ncbi:MAG: hypothetical protein QXD79_08345 [Candidatus Methanomethylicia archaeon]
MPQNSLDESCWLNQFHGLDACYDYEALGKKYCGGGYKFPTSIFPLFLKGYSDKS